MTQATVVTAVKYRLGIDDADTTFDAQINNFVDAAVRRLYPRAGYEVAPQEVTSFVVDGYGESTIDLSALIGAPRRARLVEAFNGYSWYPVGDKYHHGTALRLRSLNSTNTKLRVYGIKEFADVTTVYDWFIQAVYWFAIGEFYDYLAGNKSGYNVYSQMSGSRAVDNMRDESAYFDVKADRYIDQQIHGA